ncbi:MAG TPA: enoyl-CoA hydratase [Candidatus Limnocylindrales bacterium]|nr:enoyl-CoA hydratase [Candidatus Limnocylindrales bacterium]
MDEPFVLREDRGGVVRLTLNRGDKLNPLSSAMLEALQTELDCLREDASVRVVVLAAAGKHFCAGHDLREMIAHPDQAWQQALFARCNAMMMSLVRLPQPVIARVQGVAVAAGCQLVSMCDLAVASTEARFALPGIKSGLFCTTPGVGVSRNVSRKHAMELLLTGDPIDAPTAERWGLINRAVAPEKLDDAVASLAATIASYSAAVVRLGKERFYRQIECGMDDAYALAADAMACNMMMEDAGEGIDAFLAKRTPNWRQR